jgi:UreF/CobW/HypB/UreG, nucleotide-binding domain
VRDGIALGTYPVGLGVLFAELGSPEQDAFAVHQYGVAMTTLSAALRLMRIDHRQVQAILYAVGGTVEHDYAAVRQASVSDMASFAPMADILAAIHVRSHICMFMNWGDEVKKTTRIGVGGPVGSGKTALIEAVVPRLTETGLKILTITNDVVTTEDAKHVRRALKGRAGRGPDRGRRDRRVPSTAVREDPSMNLAAVEEMEERFPDGDVVLIESGGDNLTLTFSPPSSISSST